MTAAIYTAYHRSAPLVHSPSVIPIHVGRARAKRPLIGMIGDDTGDNLSGHNDSYCELTALYWAWKNAPADAEHIGLMHYRRLLDVTGRQRGAVMTEVSPERLHLPDWCAEVEDWLSGHGTSVDLVLPRPHMMGRTVAGNYAGRHRASDFDTARTIIARDYPDMVAAFDRIAQGRELRLGNLMIMRRSLFDRYCSWLFPILAEVGDTAPNGPASPDQRRFIGYLAERLLTVFAAHVISTEPGLRVEEVSVLNLGKTLVTPYLDDDRLNGPEHVNIAFASDRTYLPHAAAMVQSVLDNAAPDRQINLFFLYSGIGERGRSMLRDLVSTTHGNAHLHEIDTGRAFASAHRSASRAPSNTTYSRFLLFQLLPRLDRLLYLDADVIVRADVAALYDADLGGAEIAGVPDWIMTRTLTGPTPTVDPDVPELYAYQKDVLGLSDADIAGYLNAGVMIFNFAAMDDVGATGQALTTKAETGRFLFRDQDILNSHFKGRTAQVDPRWNVFNATAAAYARVPQPGHQTALEARQDPFAIHYADAAWKPWAGAAVPLSQHYWQSLIKTPFYGEVLQEIAHPGHMLREEPTGLMGGIIGAGRRLIEVVPVLRGPLLRLYAALGRPGRK